MTDADATHAELLELLRLAQSDGMYQRARADMFYGLLDRLMNGGETVDNVVGALTFFAPSSPERFAGLTEEAFTCMLEVMPVEKRMATLHAIQNFCFACGHRYVKTGGQTVYCMCPEPVKPLSKDFAARMESLVNGTKVDLDEPIDGDVDL